MEELHRKNRSVEEPQRREGMKATGLNLRHLHYFWLVAKEGSVTRAAERQGVAVQTISAQLTLLEQSVGRALLAPQGRRLVLTDAGRIALGYADQIFALAEQMQDALASSDTAQTMRLTVGISDSLPKLIASRLLDAALHLPQQVKLVCFEDRFESLLGALSVHKLDVVLTSSLTVVAVPIESRATTSEAGLVRMVESANPSMAPSPQPARTVKAINAQMQARRRAERSAVSIATGKDLLCRESWHRPTFGATSNLN